jgi:preprotein translocase subunit SecG
MFGVLISLIIVVSVLMVLVVLAQNSKGGGLTSQFGGSGAGQLMGVKKTNDLLEKVTWGLAVSLVVLTITSSLVISPKDGGTIINSPNLEKAQEQTILPPAEDLNTNSTIAPVSTPEPLDTTGLTQ